MDLTSLDCFHRNPQPLYASIGHADADALEIGTKYPLIGLNQLKADPSTPLALTFVDNFTACFRPLSGDCANS